MPAPARAAPAAAAAPLRSARPVRADSARRARRRRPAAYRSSAMASSLPLGRQISLGELDLRGSDACADGGGDHVAGERQPRRLQLVRLVIDLGRERLELAPRAAEDVEVVRDGDAQREHVERAGVGRLRKAERRRIDALPLGAHGQRRTAAAASRRCARSATPAPAPAAPAPRRAWGCWRARGAPVRRSPATRTPPTTRPGCRDRRRASACRGPTAPGRHVAIDGRRIGRAEVRADRAARERGRDDDDEPRDARAALNRASCGRTCTAMPITTDANTSSGHRFGHRSGQSLPFSRMPRTRRLKYVSGKHAARSPAPSRGMPRNGNMKPDSRMLGRK